MSDILHESVGTDALVPAVYDELRALASAYLQNEGGGHTLQPTALVHEAYVRLAGQRAEFEDPRHYFALAAQAMRRVLIDHARRRKAKRRGGERPVTLQPGHAVTDDEPLDVLALDRALVKLEREHARVARTVELRYFAGLGVSETADVLGVSGVTVKRDWRFAKAWLAREMSATR